RHPARPGGAGDPVRPDGPGRRAGGGAAVLLPPRPDRRRATRPPAGAALRLRHAALLPLGVPQPERAARAPGALRLAAADLAGSRAACARAPGPLARRGGMPRGRAPLRLQRCATRTRLRRLVAGRGVAVWRVPGRRAAGWGLHRRRARSGAAVAGVPVARLRLAVVPGATLHAGHRVERAGMERLLA